MFVLPPWRNSRNRQCNIHDRWHFVACWIHHAKQSCVDCWVGFERNCHSWLGSPNYAFCNKGRGDIYFYTFDHGVQTMEFLDWSRNITRGDDAWKMRFRDSYSATSVRGSCNLIIGLNIETKGKINPISYIRFLCPLSQTSIGAVCPPVFLPFNSMFLCIWTVQ